MGIVTPPAKNPMPALYNASPLLLPKFRKALSRQQLGIANAKLALVGDSTTAGYPGVTATTNRPQAYPAQLATLLTAQGIKAGSQSFWGNNQLPGAVPANDSRVAMTGGWAASGAQVSIGGPMLTTTTAGTLSFTPTANCDTFDVYYVANNSVVAINLDGGTATNTGGGSFAITKATVTGTLAAHTLNLVWTSGQPFIVGVDAYDSTSKQVSCWNWGRYGAVVSDWGVAGNTWDPLTALGFFAPDLTVICLTINDATAGTSLATYNTKMQAIIDKAKLSGDVALMVGVPSDTAINAAAVQADFQGRVKALGAVNSCPVVDLTERFVSFATSSALGFYGDQKHPVAIGYADVARAVARLIMSAAY